MLVGESRITAGSSGGVVSHTDAVLDTILTEADCLVLIVIVLVVVLPLIFVGLPKKAQKEINSSTLEVTNMEVTNPQPDSVHLKIDNTIRSDSSYHPRIEAFRAGLSLEGQKPFIFIEIPEAKSEGVTYITVDQDVKFADSDRFAA